MTVEKGGKTYVIADTAHGWTVRDEAGMITFKVPHGLCRTFDEVREYVLNSSLF